MAQNFTSANASIPNGNLGFQCVKPFDLFTLIVNAISFLMNSLHLCIILRLETLKRTKYRCVLINIILADITNTFIMILLFSCYDFFTFNFTYGEPELQIPIAVMLIPSNYISFHVFLVASMEKYLAICKPFSYESSRLVTRLPLNFFIIWLYIFVFGTGFAVIEAINPIAGMSAVGYVVLRTIVFAIAPNLLSGILLTKVYRELNRTRSQSWNSADDSEKRKAAMYLIIIFTLEMIVFVLNSICIIVLYCTGELVICKIWNGFIKAPYTMLNTVIYGWRTQSYRQYVRKVIGCNPRQVGNAEG